MSTPRRHAPTSRQVAELTPSDNADRSGSLTADDRDPASGAERFRALAEHTIVGLWQITPEGRTLYINPAMCKLLDIEGPDALAGRSHREFFTPESLAIMDREHAKRFHGAASSYEVELISAIGTRRNVIISGAPLLGPDGRLQSMIGTFTDITERSRMDIALREAQHRLQTVMTGAPVVIWAIDLKGTITLSEGKSLEAINLKPGQVVGQCVFDLYPNHSRVNKMHIRALKGESLEEVLVVDGVTFESRLAPLRDGSGAITGAIGVAVDITARHRTEQALWQSQQQLASMVRHTPLAVILWNTRFEVAEWNPAAETIFKYSAAEAMGRHASFIVPVPVRPHVDHVWESLMKETGGTRSTNQNVTRDGRLIMCEWYNSPLFNPQGEIIGVASLCDDVTVRKRAEEDRRHSSDMQRLVLRELDHRVRNNLASLIALIDITAQSTTSLKEFAASIKGRVQAMSSVHGLLSRGHWTAINLHDLLTAIMPVDVRGAIALNGPDAPIAPNQVTALGMILQELVANSLKYGALSRPDGRIEVRWELDHESASAMPMLNLHWRESGGPEVSTSIVPGLGTGLIQGLTRTELHGHVELMYPLEGARHHFAVSLEKFEELSGLLKAASD